MPQLIVAVVAAAAAYGAGAAATALGTSAIAAGVIGAVAGAVVAYGGNQIIAAVTPKAKAPGGPRAASEQFITIQATVEPRRVVYGQARTSGVLVYACNSGTSLEYTNLVIVFTTHPIERFDGFWFGEIGVGADQITAGEVTSGPLAGQVRVNWYVGDQTTADSALLTESPDGWSSTDVFYGCAYVHFRYVRSLYPSGPPSISAAIVGKNDIYDPRTELTGYTENLALCIRDYLMSDFGLSCGANEIDEESFIAAANLADELVQKNAEEETQPRYTMNGTFTLDRAPIDIIENMLAAGGASALPYVQGKYQLYLGEYQTPVVTLTASDVAGPIEIATLPALRDHFNSVRGTYIDPLQDWQAQEFDPEVDSDAVTADGTQIWKDLTLEFVADRQAARRIARQLYRRHRDMVACKIPVKYSGMKFVVWQTIKVTLDDLGWNQKPFRISGWSFAPDTGLVTLSLEEEQPRTYQWLYDADPGEDHPDTE